VDRLTRPATVALLVVVTLGGCRERAQAVQGEAELKDMVHRMMPAVAQTTGLRFKSEPVVLRRTRQQVRDYLIHKFDEDLPPAELAGLQSALRLFGLIPDSLELRPTMIDVLTEQVAGYYDPDSNALYIPADIEQFQLRIVVSHELVHALQDQYVRLDSIISQRHANDRRSAAQAILEGQATVAQIPVLMPEQKPDTLPLGWFWKQRSAMAAQQSQMKQFAHAPLWIREGLIFPYLGGADFIVWFRHKYFGVSVLDSMPRSTEQILHPERFALHDEPTELSFVNGADTVQWEDNLGEYETRLLFQQLLGDETEAATLATGWDGDRYEVLGPNSDALVWYSVWDDAAAAGRFTAGLQRAWAKRRAGGPTGRRADVKQLVIDGRPVVRLVDAPADWKGWHSLPMVRLSGGRE
jgi:hypothetical protein